MQELCEDYSSEEGCCLNCEFAEPECLCYHCKCKKCSWYCEGEIKGYCGFPSAEKEDWLKNYSKQKLKERLSQNRGQTDLKKDFFKKPEKAESLKQEELSAEVIKIAPEAPETHQDTIPGENTDADN